MREIEHVEPADIERRSMEIIRGELATMGITVPEEHAPVVLRAIHTSADFDYAHNLYFSSGVVLHAVQVLKAGATIVTDTNMALAGINKPGLERLHSRAACFMADEDVAREAKERGATRATVSMERAAKIAGNLIFAIGNAPTALLELERMIREESFAPSLIIGVPVGFVNVIQSKERIIASGIPCIVAQGRKGGSPIAAAIVNALLYLAGGR